MVSVDFSDLVAQLQDLLKKTQDEPWSLTITRIDNGYTLRGNDIDMVVEESDDDPLDVGEKLLWHVMDYFNLRGSKHDKERLCITREEQ